MKIRNNRLYPYPVYSTALNHYIDNNFVVETSLAFDSVNAFINYQIKISDHTILEMIKAGQIGIYMHVECSVTKFRKLFPLELTTETSGSITIPLIFLNEDIEIISVLVASQTITNYKNPNLSSDFQNENIIIPQYATVGFTNTDVFTINKRISSTGDIPSIFTITKSEDSSILTYNPEHSKINIFLPPKEYEIYEYQKGKYKRLKQLMIICPVLVEVFSDIQKENLDSNCEWYPVLEEAIKKTFAFSGFEDSRFIDKPALELAQQVLGSLFTDAMKEFEDLTNVED